MTNIQHVTEGAKIYICGYQFIARNLRVFDDHGTKVLVFDTELTDYPNNDFIRGTRYANTRGQGNHRVYSWNDNEVKHVVFKAENKKEQG